MRTAARNVARPWIIWPRRTPRVGERVFPPSTSKGAATRESQALPERRNDAAKAAAAASALGGLAAIFGLLEAFLGAELGRRELVGQPWSGGHRGHRLRYGREEEAIPPGAHPH